MGGARLLPHSTKKAIREGWPDARISALTGGMHFENITLAPITAQVGGLIDTILLVIAIVSVSLCLSLWALSVWLRDRKRLALKAEMID